MKNKTPNQVYKDNDDQTARHLNDSVHNQQVYKSVPFKDGEKVRILEEKGKFDKGKQKFSKEMYTIDKKEGYKLIIKDEKRKLKPSELLKENPKKIVWWQLSSNPNAIELLKANLNEIFWPNLSLNPNEGAIELLKENQEKIDWWNLSYNPNPAAIELLKANKTKINWQFLSGNPNPEAIELLKENQKKIDWGYLSGNPAIFDEILE